jgi:NADH-quinone oxidoreductase subunit D
MYAFREREKILDLFESLSGSRMMCDYMRFGGCRVDAGPDWIARAKKIVDAFPRFLDEFEKLIVGNEILIARTQESETFAELAINAGITGPMLRASGVNYDLRKVDGYGFIRASSSGAARRPRRLLRSPDDARARDAREPRDSEAGLRTNSGRPDHESEGKRSARFAAGRRSLWPDRRPKGELGFYLISDGGPNPVSLSGASAELHQSDVLEDMCLGHTVADVMVILGSVDIVMGEVDR